MFIDTANYAEVLYKKQRAQNNVFPHSEDDQKPSSLFGKLKGILLILKQLRWISPLTMVAFLSACNTLSGSMSDPSGVKVGDRSILVPNGPADPPSDIGNKAGIIYKRDPNAVAAAAAAANPSQQRPSAAPAANVGVMGAVQRPSWATAAAAPGQPTVATIGGDAGRSRDTETC